MAISFRKAYEKDIPAIRSLLEESHLPTESVEGPITHFFVAEENSVVVGVAGFEFYGEDALLRSVAVPAHLQKQGIGSQLVDWMLVHAKERNVKEVVLLTETAEKFFRRKGFVVIQRTDIQNEAMKQSTEFSIVCPTSSTTMIIHIQ